MTDLVQLEEHETFASASQRARGLAMQHKQQTGIRRSAAGWEVLVPAHLSKSTVRGSAADDDDYHPAESTYDPDDEREQLVEELEGDREDFARSEEEGWYYSDDDQQTNRDEHDSQYGRFQAPRDATGRTLPSGSGW